MGNKPALYGDTLARAVDLRIDDAVATKAAIAAIPAAERTNGLQILEQAGGTTWWFDDDSAATVSPTVIVPTAGSGRWIATGGAAAPGMPMQNVLRMLGAPGKIVQGNTVVIGADTYEFRDDTPPTGGTASRIWVYNGANSAASRANFVKAINGEVDAALIAGDSVATELFIAVEGITTGDVMIQSADAVGGNPAPSATATATTDGLDTATDIWDNSTCQYGFVQAPLGYAAVVVTLGAEELARGTMDVTFPFTPRSVVVHNRERPQDEAVAISGNTVSVTLTGGATPNNQSGDVVDIIAFE